MTITVELQAVLHSPEEKDFCDQLITAIKNSSTTVTNLRIARKTKSWGSTGVSACAGHKYKNSNKRELWINLGRISDKDYQPRFDSIGKIVNYAESERLKAWFAK